VSTPEYPQRVKLRTCWSESTSQIPSHPITKNVSSAVRSNRFTSATAASSGPTPRRPHAAPISVRGPSAKKEIPLVQSCAAGSAVRRHAPCAWSGSGNGSGIDAPRTVASSRKKCGAHRGGAAHVMPHGGARPRLKRWRWRTATRTV
jgi:hypothetical protein